MQNKFRQPNCSLVFTKKWNHVANAWIKISLTDINLFIAKSVLSDIPLWRNFDSLESSYFNKIKFTLYKDIVDSICLHLTNDLKGYLCDIIKFSCLTNSVNIGSSNAIYILNRANFIFKKLDFRKIKIPGVDLSGSTFIKTNFEGSDLKGVNFSDSKLFSCNFSRCDLTKAIFSNIKVLYKQKSCPKIITISKDEKLLLTCSEDKKIRLRTLGKNTILPEICSIKHKAEWAELSPCGNYIAILNREKGLQLWDIKLKKIISKWYYVYQTKHCIFSSCGRFIACNGDNFIEVFDLIDKIKCKHIKTTSGCDMAFSQSGNILLYWSGQRVYEILLSKEKHFECEKLCFKTDWQIQVIAFSPNDKYVALNGRSKHNDSIISVWNFQKKELSFILKCKEIGWIYSLSWSPIKNWLITVNFKGSILLWDVDNQTELALIRNWCRMIAKVNFSSSGKYAAFAGKNGIVKLWSIEKQKPQKNIDKNEEKIKSISFSSCEKFIYTITENYSIDRFDIKNKNWENILNKCKAVKYASFSECRKFCAIAPEWYQNSYTIDIWDLDNKILLIELNPSNSISQLKFSFCGKLLISGQSDCRVLWDLERKEAVYNIQSQTFKTAWSPSGEYFATSDWKTTIWKFDHKCCIEISNLNEWAVSLIFSKCSQFLYIGVADGSVYVWDFLKKKIIKILEGIKNNTNYLEYCPNTDLLAVGGAEKIIIIWNTETGEKLKQINTNLYELNALSIARSGKFIISGGVHKYINCWKTN